MLVPLNAVVALKCCRSFSGISKRYSTSLSSSGSGTARLSKMTSSLSTQALNHSIEEHELHEVVDLHAYEVYHVKSLGRGLNR